MALVLADRIKETSTTSGTGTLTLAGAASGFRSFAAVGNGNTTYYAIVDSTTGAWEVGIGTYTSTGTTLSRDTVYANSLGTTAKINFAANAKDVFVTYPASKSVFEDSTGNVSLPDNLTFTGTAPRITGDFTSTVPNRVMVQTETVNGATTFGIMPNGTGTVANFAAYKDSADLGNTSVLFVGISNAGAEARINSAISGTGTYLPLTVYTGGSERMRVATNGQQSSVIPGGTTLYPEYKCRAWVSFNGLTSPATINGSGNVSSVTRPGTGLYLVSFSTAMPDANYAITAFAGDHDNTGDPMVVSNFTTDTYATTGVNVRTKQGSGASQNSPEVGVAVFR